MKKSAALVVALMLLLGAAAWGEIEFGAGLTPIGGDSSGSPSQSGDFFQNSFTTAHLGWRTVGIFYLSGDFIVVPPFITEGMTSYYDSVQNIWVQGISRPAVISVYDAGFKFVIGSFSLTAQLGLNQFYIYKQVELQNFSPPSIGANLKLGAGLRLLKFLGLEVSAVSVQPSFEGAIDVIKGVFSSDSQVQSDSLDKLVQQIVPLIQLVVYL